jgi:hypothetical protein
MNGVADILIKLNNSGIFSSKNSESSATNPANNNTASAVKADDTLTEKAKQAVSDLFRNSNPNAWGSISNDQILRSIAINNGSLPAKNNVPKNGKNNQPDEWTFARTR